MRTSPISAPGPVPGAGSVIRTSRLPGAWPDGEAHIDLDAPWRADLALVDPVPDRRHGEGRSEGKVYGAPVTGSHHKGARIGNIDGQRLLAEKALARGKCCAGVIEIGVG